MKISAIISEYNPLHNGHKYQIDQTRLLTDCDGLICIMSGNFVQRGEPAIIDKWQRTKIALDNGIDLVLELPVGFALSSAEFFARGAISILNDLGVVDTLSFGSESGSVETLKKIAYVLYHEPKEYKTVLSDKLNLGLTFPKARSVALLDYFNIHDNSIEQLEDILYSSNNILGIEYCKSLLSNNSRIEPCTIKRLGGDYNSDNLNEVFSSATSIRKFLRSDRDLEELLNHVPENVFNKIKKLKCAGYSFTYAEKMFPYLKYKALTDNNKQLKALPDSEEGLYNRIYSSLERAESYQALMEYCKTKRYTFTRLSRLLTQYFIGLEQFDLKSLRRESCNYVNILGFNNRGSEILKQIKKVSRLKLISKMSSTSPDPMLMMDLLATKAYSTINKNIRYNEDFITHPIVIK